MSWAMVAMAGVAVTKQVAVDGPKAERQRKLRSMEALTQSATGRAPTTQVQESDPVGAGMSGAFQGYQMKQNADLYDAAKENQNIRNDWMKNDIDKMRMEGMLAQSNMNTDLGPGGGPVTPATPVNAVAPEDPNAIPELDLYGKPVARAGGRSRNLYG
jgi:hypothetical protein